MTFLALFIGTFVVVLGLIELDAYVAERIRFLDHPNEKETH